MFKGASSKKVQKLTSRREKLLQFLAGGILACMLQETNQDLYSYFQMVSNIQRRHEIDVGSSGQHMSGLIYCYENDCAHPVCIQGKPEKDIC